MSLLLSQTIFHMIEPNFYCVVYFSKLEAFLLLILIIRLNFIIIFFSKKRFCFVLYFNKKKKNLLTCLCIKIWKDEIRISFFFHPHWSTQGKKKSNNKILISPFFICLHASWPFCLVFYQIYYCIFKISIIFAARWDQCQYWMTGFVSGEYCKDKKTIISNILVSFDVCIIITNNKITLKYFFNFNLLWKPFFLYIVFFCCLCNPCSYKTQIKSSI
jgi:hypothetical protein